MSGKDPDNERTRIVIENVAGTEADNTSERTYMLRKGVAVVFYDENPLFTEGERAPEALKRLAEDGNNGHLNDWGELNDNVEATHLPNPITPVRPGQKQELSVSVSDPENAKVAFAYKVIPSPDVVLATTGIPVMRDGERLTGDVTEYTNLYDAGTKAWTFIGKAREEPVVRKVTDSRNYIGFPAVSQIFRVAVEGAE